MTQPASMLTSLNCKGDPASVGIRWEKWKRALEIYLLALNIDNPNKKRATLSHTGGLSLQDIIYYNISGAHVDEAEGIDVYKVALDKLDEYFLPKQSKIYERHLFKLIKQENEEKFEKFLLKLRNQVGKCKFTNSDEHLIDQIVEKGNSIELRKKILSVGDTITLDQIIYEANVEVVGRQLEDFNRKDPIQGNSRSKVNKLYLGKSKDMDKQVKYKSNDEVCSRCGSHKHVQNDRRCLVRDKRCLKCNLMPFSRTLQNETKKDVR